jgi:hypothetical protein
LFPKFHALRVRANEDSHCVTASRNPVFMPVPRLKIIPPRKRSRAARAHVVETENHPLSPFDRPVGGARRRLKTTQAAAGGLRNYGRPFCPGFLMVRPNCICPVCTDPPCPPSLFLYTPQASFFSFWSLFSFFPFFINSFLFFFFPNLEFIENYIACTICLATTVSDRNTTNTSWQTNADGPDGMGFAPHPWDTP